MATAIRSQTGLGERFSVASTHGPRLEEGLSEVSVALQGIVPVSFLGPPAHLLGPVSALR